MTEPTSPDAPGPSDDQAFRAILRSSFRSTRRLPLEEREARLRGSAFAYLAGMANRDTESRWLRDAILAAQDEIAQLVAVERRVEQLAEGC